MCGVNVENKQTNIWESGLLTLLVIKLLKNHSWPKTTSFPGLFPFFKFKKREKVLGTRLGPKLPEHNSVIITMMMIMMIMMMMMMMMMIMMMMMMVMMMMMMMVMMMMMMNDIL